MSFSEKSEIMRNSFSRYGLLADGLVAELLHQSDDKTVLGKHSKFKER